MWLVELECVVVVDVVEFHPALECSHLPVYINKQIYIGEREKERAHERDLSLPEMVGGVAATDEWWWWCLVVGGGD